MSHSSWRVLTFNSFWYFSFAKGPFSSRAISSRANFLMNLTVQRGKNTTRSKWKLLVKQPPVRGCIWLTSLFDWLQLPYFLLAPLTLELTCWVVWLFLSPKYKTFVNGCGRRASGALLGSKSIFSCSYHRRSSSCVDLLTLEHAKIKPVWAKTSHVSCDSFACIRFYFFPIFHSIIHEAEQTVYNSATTNQIFSPQATVQFWCIFVAFVRLLHLDLFS